MTADTCPNCGLDNPPALHVHQDGTIDPVPAHRYCVCGASWDALPNQPRRAIDRLAKLRRDHA